MKSVFSEKAARCGEPSYVWRSGQERRLRLIFSAAENRAHGTVLENGCGVGMYLEQLGKNAQLAVGLEYDLDRAKLAYSRFPVMVNAAGEYLPFKENFFDLILSHEVLEHVQDDQKAVTEIVRVLKPGGRLVLFVPNRGYPFETHGIYWRGKYRFGNIPLVNYLPDILRNRLAPHVRVYSKRTLTDLFSNLPVKFIKRTIIFGAYDNLIARSPKLGYAIRSVLQGLEVTPLKLFGLSHFWVVEKYS
ncbi:MAG: class I SAM-dependent methyltransferase [Anaerolineales bacterium]